LTEKIALALKGVVVAVLLVIQIVSGVGLQEQLNTGKAELKKYVIPEDV